MTPVKPGLFVDRDDDLRTTHTTSTGDELDQRHRLQELMRQHRIRRTVLRPGTVEQRLGALLQHLRQRQPSLRIEPARPPQHPVLVRPLPKTRPPLLTCKTIHAIVGLDPTHFGPKALGEVLDRDAWSDDRHGRLQPDQLWSQPQFEPAHGPGKRIQMLTRHPTRRDQPTEFAELDSGHRSPPSTHTSRHRPIRGCRMHLLGIDRRISSSQLLQTHQAVDLDRISKTTPPRHLTQHHPQLISRRRRNRSGHHGHVRVQIHVPHPLRRDERHHLGPKADPPATPRRADQHPITLIEHTFAPARQSGNEGEELGGPPNRRNQGGEG